jgi:hypothetical protein
LINSDNITSGVIKSRISAGNKCFYKLVHFRIRPKSTEVKIQIHKTMVKSIIGYVTEIWCVREREMDMERLNT